MEKLDRLGWAGGLCFTLYEQKIGVRVNNPEALERVRACLPLGAELTEGPIVDLLVSLRVGGPVPRSKVRNFHLLYLGSARFARTLDLDEIYDNLETYLAVFVGAFATERVFVHAGVVGWRDRAILIPGRSRSGKSTLVAELLRAGATYYSDEYALIDPQGFVHPYARPLSLRQAGSQRPKRLPPEELGSRAGAHPLPVALVAATLYRPGTGWKPRPLSRGQAVLELLDHTLPMMARPEHSLNTLRKVASRARNVKAVRGEAATMAHELLQEAERGPVALPA